MKPNINKRKAIRHIKYAAKWAKDHRTVLKNRRIKVTEKAIALS
jgi:hypothetical protein